MPGLHSFSLNQPQSFISKYRYPFLIVTLTLNVSLSAFREYSPTKSCHSFLLGPASSSGLSLNGQNWTPEEPKTRTPFGLHFSSKMKVYFPPPAVNSVGL